MFCYFLEYTLISSTYIKPCSYSLNDNEFLLHVYSCLPNHSLLCDRSCLSHLGFQNYFCLNKVCVIFINYQIFQFLFRNHQHFLTVLSIAATISLWPFMWSGFILWTRRNGMFSVILKSLDKKKNVFSFSFQLFE